MKTKKTPIEELYDPSNMNNELQHPPKENWLVNKNLIVILFLLTLTQMIFIIFTFISLSSKISENYIAIESIQEEYINQQKIMENRINLLKETIESMNKKMENF